MKAFLRKVLSVFCVVALLLSLGVVSVSFDTKAAYNSSSNVSTWETVVETLTMTGDKGVTGSQGDGSYTTDPRSEGHGAVYKLHATSSPSFQVGKNKEAITENTDAYCLESGATYRLTFDYMWGAGSIKAATDGSGSLGIGLVWGSLLNGTDSTLPSGTATRKKFKASITSYALNTTNATSGTAHGYETLVLNDDSEWMNASTQFTTSGTSWNTAYKYLMIQVECDNSVNGYKIVNDATLYVDNVKLEKLTTTNAAGKMQVVWENVVETLHMENDAGVTGNQGAPGYYTDDPNDAGHGRVYRYVANSSDSVQIGKDNNATVTDTEGFRMDGGVTYKLSFDYMWGAGSTSSAYSDVYSHDINLVWGTNLAFGTGKRAVFASNIAPSYVLDDSNSTLGTTSGGTSIRTQNENSQWYHCEYVFTTSTSYSSAWRDDLTLLMIQNECNGDGNSAALYIDNITVDRAFNVTATEAKALTGNVNSDDSVDSSDAIELLYNIHYPSAFPAKALCDYNNDGIVDSSDAIYLLYNVMFGSDQYPIKGKLAEGNIITPAINYLDSNNSPIYRVVYPATPTKGEISLATTVQSGMKSKLGVTNIDIAADTNSSAEYFEVLIGDTKHTESAQALEYLSLENGGRDKDFVICTINNKIVINAHTQTALTSACNYFINHLVRKGGMLGGVNYIYTNTDGYSEFKINGVSVSRFQIVKPRFGTSYLTSNKIDGLISAVSEDVGYSLVAYDDTVSESVYEIIIGDSDRAGVNKKLSSESYSINIRGNKVYLNGGSAHTIAMAVSEFSKMIADGNITNIDSKTGKYSDAIKNYDNTKEYTLVWGDDFNYVSSGKNGISTDKWRVLGPGDYDDAGRDGRISVRGNTPDVIKAANGILEIRGKYDDEYYYGAMIATDRTMAFKYGYVETRMSMPKGSGYWIALWSVRRNLASGNNPYGPEVDIIEMNADPSHAAPNIHGWGKAEWPEQYNVSQQTSVTWDDKYSHWHFKQHKTVYHPDKDTGGTFFDEMHTFGFLSTPERVQFTMDGVVYIDIDMTQQSQMFQETMDCYQYLRLSQATCFSGTFAKSMADDDPAWFDGSNRFDVDYVHLYQLNDGIQKIHLGSSAPPAD